MRSLIVALVAASFAVSAHSDLVATSSESGQELRLLESTCTHAGTLAMLPESLRPQFKNARVMDKKGAIQIYGCWIDYPPEESVVVVLENGQQFAMKLSAFKDRVI